MASHRNHIDRALHNEALLATGALTDDFPDWYITVTFYAAVHWLRAYLALNRCAANPSDDLHYDEFGREIRRIHANDPAQPSVKPFEAVISEFQDLKSLARNSRYRCHSMPSYARQLTEADMALKKIKAFVTARGIIP